MNYIKLMNNIWDLREQGLITQHECDLYCYLVHRSNKLDWQNPFAQSSEVMCAILGIGRNALSLRRSKLRKLGLIDFKEGTTKTKPAEYEICPIKKIALRSAKKEELYPKPTIKEVKAYCREKSIKADAQAFFEYYDAKDWTVNKRRIIDWKPLLDKWASRRKTAEKKKDFAKQGKSISNVRF